MEEVTYHYISNEEPIKYDGVLLGIDLGSDDITVYYQYCDGIFTPITKEKYEKYYS